MASSVLAAICSPISPLATAATQLITTSVSPGPLRDRTAAALRLRRQRCGTRRNGSQCGVVVLASIRDAQQLVQSGIIRSVSSGEVSVLLSEDGYKLLDIRPTWERKKAYVAGSYHVPLFIEDVGPGAITLLKKGILAGQGGWWMGQKLTTRNEQFLTQVHAAVPEGQKLVVACGEGLRSLLALEELHNAGFKQLAWITGGFNAVRDEDFKEVEGSTKLRFATVGGVSEYVLKFAIFIKTVLNSIEGS